MSVRHWLRCPEPAPEDDMSPLTALMPWQPRPFARRFADAIVDGCLNALEAYVDRCDALARRLNG